ncbi:MAG TPA: hydroxymethylbilane synthase [Halobacteriales archaeon]|nr:hydroxymethylbilane synthase [Halobacteriales archaeon]
MRTRGTVRLATRGSDLALRQAAVVKSALEDRRYEVELVEVETRGDQIRDELIHRLGTTGAFVRSLDEKVIEGEVDAAVHSMKDMPTEAPEELIVAGIPPRAEPGDVLVTPDGSSLDELPAGTTVGTSSLRRRAQLRAERADLEVVGLRGNVDTRVEKLLAPTLQREHERRLEAEGEVPEGDQEGGDGDDEESEAEAFDRSPDEWFDGLAEVERQALGREVDVEYDAIVLAAAGLARLGLDRDVPTSQLPIAGFVPSPGQGAIAVTALDGSDASEAIHDAVDHPRTRVETTVERVILAELGGGCIAPIGVYAVVQGEHVRARVQVLSTDGEEVVAASRDLPVRTYAEGAREFADDLAERGAADLIDAAREEAEADDDGYREEESSG